MKGHWATANRITLEAVNSCVLSFALCSTSFISPLPFSPVPPLSDYIWTFCNSSAFHFLLSLNPICIFTLSFSTAYLSLSIYPWPIFPSFPSLPPSISFSVGEPIVVERNMSPSSAEVDRLHGCYLEALTKLFEQHKAEYRILEHQHLIFTWPD